MATGGNGSLAGDRQKGERRSWRRFVCEALSDKEQVLLHHRSVACKGLGRQRGHRSGMKLLLELPEFTSGSDEYGRSWPIGQQIARYDFVSGNDSGAVRMVPRDSAGACLAGMTLMDQLRRAGGLSTNRISIRTRKRYPLAKARRRSCGPQTLSVRQRRGVTPVARMNVLVKWLWSAKPHASEIICRGMDDVRMYIIACSMR